MFAVVSLSLLISSMQFTMVTVALPDVIDGLNAPLRLAGWIVTVFTLGQAISQPIAGKLSDEFDRRLVFAGGIVLFGLSCVGCALASNIYVMILFRACQGLAGGSLVPSAYGIIGEAMPERRAQALGLLSSILPIGTVLGPNLGGVLTDTVGWRWTFAIAAPICFVAATAIMIFLKKSEPKRGSSIDYGGAAILAVGLTGIIIALTELSRKQPAPNMTLVAMSLLIGFGGVAYFLRWISRQSNPVIPIEFLRRKEFALVNLLNFFYGVSVFGLFSFISLYAVERYGMSTSETGALLTPRAIGMILFAAIAAIALPRTGYRKPIILGLSLVGASFIVLSLGLDRPSIGGVTLSNFVVLSACMGLTGVGFGIAGPAANNAAIELAPDKIAAISGLRGLFRSIGGTIGGAVIVLITTRASSTADGLELAFLGLGAVTILNSLVALGIRDKVGGSVTPVED